MRIEFEEDGLWKVSWTAPGGQSLYAFALGSNRDEALESWLEIYSLYKTPDILSGPFFISDMYRAHSLPPSLTQ
jgi:hypothetical protein